LARKKALDGAAMNPENAADADRVEPAVVDQSPNCLRVDAELRRDVADADQSFGFFAYRGHNSREALQVQRSGSWADRINPPRSRT